MRKIGSVSGMIEISGNDEYSLIGAETAAAIKDVIVAKIPKVKDIVKGRLPEYLKPLYILSSATYQTNDNKASYRVAVCNKSPNVSTAIKSTYLVLDTKNNYRGFADNEERACELAELVIKKPIPDFIRR